MIIGFKTLLQSYFHVLLKRIHQIRHSFSQSDTLIKLHELTVSPKNLSSPSPTIKFYPKEPRDYIVDRLRTDLAEGEERVLSLETEEAPELTDVEQEYRHMTVQDDYKHDQHDYQRAVDDMINEGFRNTERLRYIHIIFRALSGSLFAFEQANLLAKWHHQTLL